MQMQSEKLACILKWLTLAVLALNLLVLPALPFLLSLRYNYLTHTKNILTFIPLARAMLPAFLFSLCFYFLCGVCSAILLWQGFRLLKNIERHRAFVMENARYMARVSMCLFAVSALALVRTVIWLGYHSFAQVLMAYNTLFVPVFFIAGLLFRILAGIFSEAARIKEENDLTI